MEPHIRKKLIEVALPLDAINAASAREKSIRHGHPSTLHLWWARRPLAAARAVIFAQMVDDPSGWPDLFPAEEDQERERRRLFRLVEELVKWENTTNEELLQAARDEIRASWRRTCEENADHPRVGELFDPDRLPAFHDPFAGGGALPLEAQRLGLEAHASDLNPVAVLINKAMIEIPPKFAGRPPVNPEARREYLGTRASRSHEAGGSAVGREAGGTPAFPGWKGAQGLAEDVRYYGRWMRDEAEKRIGRLYPKVEVTAEMARGRPDLEGYVGRKLTVIAWLWARTAKSPNPAFRDVDVPLASTFMLSTKKGKEAYVEPVIEGGGYRFTVKVGAPEPGVSRAGIPEAGIARNGVPGSDASKDGLPGNAGVPPPSSSFPRKRESMRSGNGVSRDDADVPSARGTKLSRGANFRCVMSDTPIAGDYIKAEGKAGRMGTRLMAIVAEGDHGRVYLAPTSEHEERAQEAEPEWRPDGDVPARLTGGTCVPYGLTTWGDLFTPRQLVALTTFSDLVTEAIARVKQDILGARASRPLKENAGGTPAFPGDKTPLYDGGVGAAAYAEAVGMYSGLAASRATDAWSTIVSWRNGVEATRGTFSRQALPMVWDYAEANPFSEACGNWMGACLEWLVKAIALLPGERSREVFQADAATQEISKDKVISTDPPYYDNIGYADLSDFFYVWLRRSLRPIYPDLFATVAVPKAEELVATPYRHGGKEEAEAFFLDGMSRAMRRLSEQTHPAFPVTIYYAFKQSESVRRTNAGGTPALPGISTGWETFLDAVIRAGFAVTGTWPIRTEREARSTGIGVNALASSIVLVCRKRPADAPLATRREFVAALKAELPAALARLQSGNIAPVDLAQAAIGPGMAVYTRYAKVLDASGQPVSVRGALALINRTLDETLAEQEGDFDADSRWALAWFEQHGFDAGEYGLAETLSKAKNTSVGGLVEAGLLESRAGAVRLLKPVEFDAEWDPATDSRLTAWETVHQLIRTVESGGETAAADLVRKLGGVAETARELAYRLYVAAERRSRAAEALSYNALVQSWPEIARLARTRPAEQTELL